MVGTTAIVEVLGKIIFNFTKSVAEHYNVDEREHASDLFGYNPLEDRGTEWYCQPVGEVIYQEYSNVEATTGDYLTSGPRINARLIDVSSTEDNEETPLVTEDRAMAWKRLRPSILRTMWNSLLFGFLMSILTAGVVGMISILVYYISYQSVLLCEDLPEESLPKTIQWIRTISEIFFASILYLWFFLDVLLFFRPFQISGMKLKLLLVSVPFFHFDSCYRVAIEAFGISHSRLTSTERLPSNVLFFTCVFFQAFLISRHLDDGPRKIFIKLFFLFTLPCMLTFVVALLVAFFIYPAYNKQDKSGKIMIALFAPLIVVALKGISRNCVQRLWKISHPGTSFVMLVPLYCGSAVFLRLLQVELDSLKSVALIGVIHGIAEVIERCTIALIDHIYNQVWERRLVSWGGFRTPRRERLAADIAIMSMVYEASAVVSVNGFLYLYRYFFTSYNSAFELLKWFAVTTSVPLAIEWFFTSVSIAIETRYLNIPVTAVWRKRWKRHILVGIVNAVAITLWTTTSLLIAVQGRFDNKTSEPCKVPFS